MTDHQHELQAVKDKAYGILREEDVLKAFETILRSNVSIDGLLGKFSSPIVKAAPNRDIETEHDEKFWTHHAYLVGGVQTIQVSYFKKNSIVDSLTDKAELFVFNNKELVLQDGGSAERAYHDWGMDPWTFADRGGIWLEVVKLNKVWMGAVKEIASELKRVEKLQSEEFYRDQQTRAEEKKSNFDLGDFE